jgi:hypothetical protein
MPKAARRRRNRPCRRRCSQPVNSRGHRQQPPLWREAAVRHRAAMCSIHPREWRFASCSPVCKNSTFPYDSAKTPGNCQASGGPTRRAFRCAKALATACAQGAAYEAPLLRFRSLTVTAMAALLAGLPRCFGFGCNIRAALRLGIALAGGFHHAGRLSLHRSAGAITVSRRWPRRHLHRTATTTPMGGRVIQIASARRFKSLFDQHTIDQD